MNPMQELLQAIEAIRFDKTTPQVTQIWFQFWSENEDGSFICTSDRKILNYDSHGDYIDEPIYLPDLTELLPEGSHEEFQHCYFVPFNETDTRAKLLELGFLETTQLMPKED